MPVRFVTSSTRTALLRRSETESGSQTTEYALIMVVATTIASTPDYSGQPGYRWPSTPTDQVERVKGFEPSGGPLTNPGRRHEGALAWRFSPSLVTVRARRDWG